MDTPNFDDVYRQRGIDLVSTAHVIDYFGYYGNAGPGVLRRRWALTYNHPGTRPNEQRMLTIVHETSVETTEDKLDDEVEILATYVKDCFEGTLPFDQYASEHDPDTMTVTPRSTGARELYEDWADWRARHYELRNWCGDNRLVTELYDSAHERG